MNLIFRSGIDVSSKPNVTRYLIACFVISAAGACGVPNLEPADCSEARYVLRTFYSMHFDAGMTGNIQEDLPPREKYILPEFRDRLSGSPGAAFDPFTLSDSLPTTFKLGECSITGTGDLEFRLQVYWRDDQNTVQKDIYVVMKRTVEGWLMSNISSTRSAKGN